MSDILKETKTKKKPKPKRLPVGRQAPFNLPTMVTSKTFENRKVKLISAKNFKNLGKITFESEHLGTLKK